MKPLLLAMAVLAGVLFIRVNGDRFQDGEYVNRGGGFAIEFPAGWTETEVPFSTFAVAGPDAEENCVVLVQDVPASVTTEDLMNSAERRGSAARYERLTREPIRVGGVDGYRSQSQMKVRGQRFRNAELHLIRNATAITVQCLASEETYDLRFIAFARVLDSFRWLD